MCVCATIHLVCSLLYQRGTYFSVASMPDARPCAGRGCHWMVQACRAVFLLHIHLRLGHKNALICRKRLVGTLFLVLPYVNFNAYRAGALRGVPEAPGQPRPAQGPIVGIDSRPRHNNAGVQAAQLGDSSP